jgi:predicted HD phosphohydrolase
MPDALMLLARVTRSAIRTTVTLLHGHTVGGSPPPADDLAVRPHLLDATPYFQNAERIRIRHAAQTVEDVAALRRKYAAPVFGRVSVWSLIEKLAYCIDPCDGRLFCTSQLVHVLQMIAEMERDGTATDEFVLAALVHDIGKVLLLAGEAPENVVGMNDPIGAYEPGIGLGNCVLQWNHDEFAYTRLKDHLPDGLAWLIRHHSIKRESCDQYMDARDRAFDARYLDPFQRYDHGTKSPYFLPTRPIDDYRHIVEKAFPKPIDF